MKKITATIALLSLFTIAAGQVSAQQGTGAEEISADVKALEALINSDDRPDRHKKRDKYRRPFATLQFMGLKPEMTVAEIFPGGQGGWYRRIIEPFVTDKGAYYPVSGSNDWPKRPAKGVPYGQVDIAFVFRAHGFMIYDEPAQKHVDDLFKMLRPGGYFGIVDHAGNEDITQDPDGDNGYINESYFRAMAEKAGFVLVKSSDINRNAADTKDHPNGVWSLPPTLRGWSNAKYIKIGESDRFTHLYQKPLE